MEEQISPESSDQSKSMPLRPVVRTRLTFLIIIAGVIVAGYFVSAKLTNIWPFDVSISIPTFTPRPSNTPTTITSSTVPTFTPGDSLLTNTTWKTYRNQEYGFEFEYPTALTLREMGATDYCQNKISLSGGGVFTYFCVTTQESIQNYNMSCRESEACLEFQPQECERKNPNSCEEYIYQATGGFWSKEGVLNVDGGKLRIELASHMNFDATTVPEEQILNDNSITQLVEMGKIAQSNLDSVNIFNRVLSSLKFTK